MCSGLHGKAPVQARNTHMTPFHAHVQAADKVQESLEVFNTTYLDLFLLHYPRYIFGGESWLS